MTSAPTIHVIPFGQCREHVSEALPELGQLGCKLVDPSALRASQTAEGEPAGDAPRLSIAVLDDRDEARLGDVERVAAIASTPFVVFYVRDADRASQARAWRLAERWRACVIEVESTPVAIAALRCLAEPITVPGLVAFDFAAVADAISAPSAGTCHTVTYGADHGTWREPASWRPALADAERVLLSIRCAAPTTLSEFNDICAKLTSLAPRATFELSCNVVSDGRPAITVIGLATATRNGG